MSKVCMSVSHYDLNHFLKKEWLTVEDCSKEQIDEVLNFLGMELGTYEVEEVLHRPIYSPNNQPWRGKRFIGWERQDKQWMFSKKSSIENIIAAQDDIEHAAELMRMSRQSNNTADTIDILKNSAPKETTAV